ncbi:iron ABC transporter permease [Hyphomonas sp. FCG-A18]|uniref:ABC transporter permease n=1 Tax=Hyphomonas sp. FCG-A18 TaxID=3080019 RepID=UPI002B29523E|nr:iron ABC transporter permease [Hyphomonas sp. FCG-A18]
MNLLTAYQGQTRRLTFLTVTGFILLPVAVAIWFGLTLGGGETWSHILNNRLAPYTATTLGMLCLVAVQVLLIAVPAAWLVSRYRFPGRAIFNWALVLPLAVPGYVMAYVWAELSGVSGPFQTFIRDMTGLRARDYFFPDVYNLPGLSFVLATTLFPYVYITARAAFANQSLSTLEAARSLGASHHRTFWHVALPAARPAIVAGLALAMMEAAADYGAADFLGIPTLGVGIIRAWNSFGEPATAARLALVLIAIAFAFMIIEKVSRGQRGSQETSSRWRSPDPQTLSRTSGLLASAFCGIILLVSFILPVGRLLWLSLELRAVMPDISGPLISTLLLASFGTILGLICAIALTLSARGRSRQAGRLVTAAGYAAPGAVLALGAVLFLSSSNLSISGPFSLAILVWVYASRFTAAGSEPLQAALERAPKSLDHATRSLGATGLRRLIRVDLPLISPGLWAGLLILFVETLKELPATLMLRPFGWDTLAVEAYKYAADERLAQAVFPSLLITLAGLAPVLLLSWQMSRSRQVQ